MPTKSPARSPSSRPKRASSKITKTSIGITRSVCPVACTLDVIGDKWSLLVIRDLMVGKSHYSEFLASPEGVATNILSTRLARLCEHGLIERFPSDTYPGREAYRLTNPGKALRPLLEQMVAWGLKHVDGTSVRLLPR